jgi:hypothetical protein
MVHLPFQDRCDVVPFEQISDLLDRPKAWSIDQQHCHVYSRMPSTTHLRHSPLKQSGRQWHSISSSAWMKGWLYLPIQIGCLRKQKAGSSTVMPIIISLYRNPQTHSVACFIATNSLPKVLVSQEFCFFEYQ